MLSHFLTNAPVYDRTLHLLGSWGFIFGAKFCFDSHFVLFQEEAHHTEKHLPQWVSSSKQEALIPQQDGAPACSAPQEPAAGNLSSLFFCDGGVSIWPRTSLSQNSALSDIAISWFLSTAPLFSLSLCLHSELSYFGAQPACFSDSI